MTEQAANGDARIIDRGYQHYTGRRLRPGHAPLVMVRAALRRGMGIRRPPLAKILPWLLIGIVFVPEIFVLALRVFIPAAPRAFIPSYPSLYPRTTIFVALFAGLVAPDLLCADRRERVLSLYFAAPLTRLGYVAAQAAGLAILLLALTLGPMLLIFVGNTLLAPSAATYVGDHLDDLWHLVLGGGLLALYYGGLALAVAAFTDRRAYASGAFLGLLLVSSAAGNILARRMSFAGHEQFALVDLLNAPIRAVQWLFGAPLAYNLNGWAYMGVSVGVIVVGLALLVWRYLGVRD